MVNLPVLMKQLDPWIAEYRKLVFNPSAKSGYDLLGGSVVWEDEVPSLRAARAKSLGFLRHVLLVRLEAARAGTTPSDAVWEHFQQAVPSWPGFRAERGGQELLAVYERLMAGRIPPRKRE